MPTYLDAAVAVLGEEGGPLHYREIARRAREGGMIPETKSMAANVLKAITTHLGPPNGAFAKVAPGVYALGPDHGKGSTGKTAPRAKRRPNAGIRLIGDTAPSSEYSEYLYDTEHGAVVTGTFNQGATFVFCEKDSRLFNFGTRGRDVSSALYALLDTAADTVYVGITRRGGRRIADHWRNKNFTHMVIMSDRITWNMDLMTKLEGDLTGFFRSLAWRPVNQVGDIRLEPRDMRTRAELLPPLRHIAARVDHLAHGMGALYPGPGSAGPGRVAPPAGGRGAPGRPGRPGRAPFVRVRGKRCSWVWPCAEASYRIVRRELIWASRAAPERIGARVLPGDRVTFYVKERRAFCGVYELVGAWYPAPRPVWPGEDEAGRAIYPSQVRLRAVAGGCAGLDGVRARLGIFRGAASRNAGTVLQPGGHGYPANHGRPVPEADMEAILGSVRASGPG